MREPEWVLREVVFAAHEPSGPHLTLPTVPDRSVAQFNVTESCTESVRYGYRVNAETGAATAVPPISGTNATDAHSTARKPKNR